MDAINVICVQLSEDVLTEGKPIDGLTHGTFVGMSGWKSTFTKEELPEYATKTAAAIAATMMSTGEVRGLPIDCQQHDHGDAAGWIVGAELVGDVVRFAVKWTDLGVDLIKRGLQAFFSASVDTARKVVLGGSLTNWPATRDIKDGIPLLAPVELAEHLGMFRAELEESEEEDGPEGLSYEERVERIRQAWHAFEPITDGPNGFVDSVYAEHVIIERKDGTFKVPYHWEGEEVIFAAEDAWTLVRKTWLEAAKEALQKLLPKKSIEGETIMGNLSDEDRTAIAAELVPALVAQLSGPPDAELLPELDVAELDITPLAELIDTKADAKMAAMLTVKEREGDIANFVSEATGGTEEKPVGLPVASDDLVAFLTSLDDKQLEQAKAIFGAVIDEGVKDFAELGHSRKVTGNTELADEMKAHLRKYLKADEENTIGEFFTLNAAELGAREDYNLSEFEKKE